MPQTLISPTFSWDCPFNVEKYLYSIDNFLKWKQKQTLYQVIASQIDLEIYCRLYGIKGALLINISGSGSGRSFLDPDLEKIRILNKITLFPNKREK
jgi:hypothetical protein